MNAEFSMPTNWHCKINSVAELTLLSKLNRAAFDGREEVLKALIKKDGFVHVTMGNASVHILHGNCNKTPGTEYKLPIPDGWELVDTSVGRKPKDYMILDIVKKEWCRGTQEGGQWEDGNCYIVPKQKPVTFPAKHYFLNTPENREAFAKQFPSMRWSSGTEFTDASYCKNSEAIGHGFPYLTPKEGATDIMTHGREDSYSSEGYTRYYFDHEKEPGEHKVGDIVVVVDGSCSAFANGTTGSVVGHEARHGVDLLQVSSGSEIQFFSPGRIRHATEAEKAAYNGSRWNSSGPSLATMATAEYQRRQAEAAKIFSVPNPSPQYIWPAWSSSPISIVTQASSAIIKHDQAWPTQTTEPSSITISTTTSAAQSSGQPTPDGDEADMLTQSEKDEILALVRGAKGSNENPAAKTAGLVKRAVRGTVKWALAPARPVGRLALKLIQYTVFFATAGAGAYTAYYAYNHAGNLMPFEIRMKQEDSSPSDDVKARQITEFAKTGGINT